MKRPTSKQQTALGQIKKQLKVIFIFYSSFGDRDNYKLLKNQSYRRMLCDAQISRTEQSVKEFDIIYSKCNKNKSGLTFKEFTDTLPEIAKMVYGEKEQGQSGNIKGSLMRLIKDHFLVLEEHIMSKMDFGEDINCLKEPHEISSFEILVQIKPILHKIYQQYWHPESKPTIEKCFSNLENFLRDFQLCPQLANKSIAFIIFQSILQQQSQHAILEKFTSKVNDNKLFSFKRFISALVDFALIGARKQGMEGDSQSSKVIHLLERMELSNGFQKIEKLIQPSMIKPTLLVNQELYISTPSKSRKQNQYQFSRESQYTSNKNNNSSYLQEYYSIQSMGKLKSPQNPGRLTVINKSPDRRRCMTLEFSENENEVVRKFQNQLRIRFQVFCSYGETLNTITLKTIKLSKILKEIGILTFIKQHELDLIISNLLRSSPSGKIEFPQFVKILSEVSEKIKMPFEKIVITILEYEGESGVMARKIESKESSVIGNQDPEVYQLLDMIQKPLRIYFQFYSKNKSTLNFVQFSKFMYDFQLFPFLISKPRLFKIFNEIVDRFMVKEKHIDFEMFKEAVGLCSLEIIDSRLRKVEKLLLLLERMNDSNAPKVVLKALGSTRNTYGMKVDFLGDARKKYSSFYEKEIFYERSVKRKEEQNFDSIMLEI